jgi:protein SCO1/2
MRIKHITISLIVFLVSCSGTDEKGNLTEKEVVLPLPFFNSADFTPEWIDEASDDYSSIHTIGDFELTNQEGEIVNNQTFANKIYVADFFFSSCGGICPKLSKNMATIQEHFKDEDDVLLISHTVMPSIDSASVLKGYSENFEAIPGKWHFVTGEQAEIYDLARTSYFADEDFEKTKDVSAFVHTENFILVDELGRIRGVYNGTIEFEVNHLIEHITQLQEESLSK